MVGMTRAHLADPHITNKILSKREGQIRPCVGMGYCIDSIYAGQAVCVHNAATGRETDLPHVVTKSDGPKIKVVVVGAGPGGLEAARVAAERGHSVKVFEAAPKAGGQILIAAALKRRKEILGIVDWRVAECERLGVEFLYNSFAGVDHVLAEDPDCVIIATGGVPDLGLLSSGQEFATTGWDILTGAATSARSVIMIDNNGSHPGLTVAEHIAEHAESLEVISPERTLAPEIGATGYPAYVKALNAPHVRVTLNLRAERLERRGNRIAAIFMDEYRKEEVVREADQVVVEYGTAPVDDLYFELRELSTNRGEITQPEFIVGQRQKVFRNPAGRFSLFRIGDAVASRNIHAAILDAYRLTVSL
jgi:N-methyl-L-proline demethylase